MSLDILILAGMVHLTAPAAPAPEQYMATAYALPGVGLAYRGFDGWVAPGLCFERCQTAPGQPTQLLRGEFSAGELADLQITVWRRDGDRWVQVMHCARWFDGTPICARWP